MTKDEAIALAKTEFCPDCGEGLDSCSACEGYGGFPGHDDEDGRAPIECHRCEGSGYRQECDCGWKAK